jgi:hypothetical protein
MPVSATLTGIFFVCSIKLDLSAWSGAEVSVKQGKWPKIEPWSYTVVAFI